MFYVVTFFRLYTPCCRFCFFFSFARTLLLFLCFLFMFGGVCEHFTGWNANYNVQISRYCMCEEMLLECVCFFSLLVRSFFSLFVWNKGNDEKRINTIKHTDRRSNNNAHGEEPERKKTRHGQTHKALLKITLLYWACLNNSF